MNWYGGIDPGKNGGFAIVSKGNDEKKVFPWDDTSFVKFLRDLLENGEKIECVCVEKVNAMPGNGSVSMFKFGQSFGFIIGVLTALKIPFQLVPPRVWKKEFSLDNDKQKSIETCQRLFPDVNLIPPRCRNPHDGEAESLLLAAYASRHF